MTAVINRGQHKEKPLGNKFSLSSFLLAFRSPETTEEFEGWPLACCCSEDLAPLA